jgi:hypothetical protein
MQYNDRPISAQPVCGSACHRLPQATGITGTTSNGTATRHRPALASTSAPGQSSTV